MAVRNLLYADEIRVNDKIAINIPTIGEVLRDEDNYFSIISTITATPYDMMVQLDDIGVDFSTIDDYQLFLLMFNVIKKMDTSLIFKGLDLTRFELMVNTQNGMQVMRDDENDITIDKAIYCQICDAIRKIHHLKRENKKPGNDEAKKFMIERARKKLKRKMRKAEDSALEGMIVALVNTEQFSYTYKTVQEVTVYQFYESLHQIIWKVDYDNKMFGIYSGTINAKDLRQDELNWLAHK